MAVSTAGCADVSDYWSLSNLYWTNLRNVSVCSAPVKGGTKVVGETSGTSGTDKWSCV